MASVVIGTPDDVPVIQDIPAIHVGATWRKFSLDFFTDEALIVPMSFTGKQMQSQVWYPNREIWYPNGQSRFTVTVTVGVPTNRLLFSIPYSITQNMPPGVVMWDLFVQDGTNRDPIAVGQTEVFARATQWA